MTSENIFYAGFLLLSATISSVLAVLSRKRRAAPGSIAFSLLMWAVVEWAFTYAMEMLSAGLSAKILWSKFQYIGIVSIAPLWLMFGLSYSRRDRWLARNRVVFLWIEPVVILTLAATNEWHRLIWSEIKPAGVLLIYEHGPATLIHAVYSYTLVLLGAFWMLQAALRAPRLYRRQAGTILIGALVPWTVNILYLFGITPLPGLDLTPYAFTVTGLMFAWSLFRFQLLEIVPAAHEALFASLTDGALALDGQNKLVDINPAAQKLLGITAEAVGQKITKLLQAWPNLLAGIGDSPEKKTEIATVSSPSGQWLELTISSIRDRRDRPSGRLIVLRDVTERNKAEKTLQESESRYRSLFEHSPVALWEQDYSCIKSRIDELKKVGVDDIPAYLCSHPEFVRTAVSQVRILGVNSAAVKLYEADAPHQLLQNLAHVFSEQSFDVFREAMICIAQGRTFLSAEDKNRTLLGRSIDVAATWAVAPGHEAHYDRVYVSDLDITEIKRAEAVIAASEERFRALVQNSYDIIAIIDPESVVMYESPSAEKALGYSITGKKALDLIHPDDTAAVRKNLAEFVAHINPGTPRVFRIRHADGTWIYLEAIGKNLLETPGIRGLFITARDITWRKLAEIELRKNEELYSKLVSTLPDIIVITDIEGNIQFVNNVGVRISGNPTADDLKGKSIFSFIAPEDRARAVENARLRFEKTLPPAEYMFIDKDGHSFPFEVNGDVLHDPNGTPYGLVFACRDLTERKQTEAALRATLREKEVLFKELHHRVKNNMQVISSLLNHQARMIKDPDVLEMFQESQGRIRSMALVHEKIYRSQDLSSIDFADYIHGLVVQLFRSHQTRTGLIEFKPELEKILLNVSTAIPLGLIINELVMNVLKHAYPDGRKGELRIQLKRGEGENFALVVKDTGIGFPENLDFRKTETLGMQIVTMLVQQIGGTIALKKDGGTEFRIVFSELKEKAQA